MTIDADRVRAGEVAKELEAHLIERNISRAKAVLFVNRHVIHKALLSFSQVEAAPADQPVERVLS